MKSLHIQRSKGYIATGGIGMVVAVAYLGLALELPVGRLSQPGAAVFPIMVGVILLIGSLAAVWEGWRMDNAAQLQLPAGADLKRLLGLVGLLFVYLLTLPWLGQLTGSVLFSIALMRILSSLSWLRVLAYSLAMSVGTYALFVYFLKVPMPPGVLAF